jgi:sugar (pentulose or hexulose) kinase
VNAPADHSLIIDVGKTSIKCHMLNEEGESIESSVLENTVEASSPYPHFDTERIWRWILDTISKLQNPHTIGAINVTTHGACAALLDGEGKLVLPVLDYEYTGVQEFSGEYAAIRPGFEQTLSPDLPAGLNLGRQLYWQKKQFPEQFGAVQQVLLYPQYWVWRLSGVAVTEVTSLGCHTDLWLVKDQRLSSLATTLGIENAFPPTIPAYQAAGSIKREIAEATGLPRDCAVYAGVHDSNSSVARYLYSTAQQGFTVISTGTWIITMCVNGSTEGLREDQDTLANVSVLGDPLPSARFMGGREFDRICQLTSADTSELETPQDIEALIEADVFALPSFADAGGPFNQRAGEIIGQPQSGKALATLYLALMIDYELQLLGARKDVIFGSFSNKNPLLCQLLAQMRPEQRILLSGDTASTIRGAWCLTRWTSPPPPQLGRFDIAAPTRLSGLLDYRCEWRRQCDLPR